MERWQFYFMIGSGFYLLILGVLMVKNKKSMSKGIGIYNIIVAIISIIGGVVGKSISKVGNRVFLGFVIVLIISFVVFAILKLFERKEH